MSWDSSRTGEGQMVPTEPGPLADQDDALEGRPDDVRHAVAEIIGTTAGFASLCWEPKPTGVFDSSLASGRVDTATDEMMRLIASELEVAWGIIANAGEGNWDIQTSEWRTAAIAFRERYHAILASRTTPSPLVPVCHSCGRSRTLGNPEYPMDAYDYSPLQVVTGAPLGWYSADDGEMCPACTTKLIRGQ